MFNLETIYHRLWHHPPRMVAEVGVNEPEKCSVAPFLRAGIPGILVEPLPWCAERLRDSFPTARVIEGVIGDGHGTTILYDRGEGSWIDDVPAGCAPDEHVNHSAMQREAFHPQFLRRVPKFPWWQVEHHRLDVLCVDTEGAEWFVVRDMRVLPRLVRLETHFTHSGWRNPYLDRIHERLAYHGYDVLGEDVSDTLWALRDPA
jgi:hypothetical protein